MAMDYIELDLVPCNEECAQIGCENFECLSRAEARAYINQLTRKYGEPPATVSYSIEACSHDFGIYYEVRIDYCEESEADLNYVFGKDDKDGAECGDDDWDDEAVRELGPEYFLAMAKMAEERLAEKQLAEKQLAERRNNSL